MPTLAQVQSQCDSLIDTIYNKLTARQSNYFINASKYWGGGLTHSVIPHHTTAKWDNQPPDRLDIGTVNFDKWSAFITDLTTTPIPCAFEVHQYAAPSGKGYVLVAIFFYNDAQWRRSVNVGPETYMDHQWQDMT